MREEPEVEIKHGDVLDAVRMFKMVPGFPRLRCPCLYNGEPCDAVPHMVSTVMGINIPPDSTSGPGLIIQFMCEWGHQWQLRFIDHSGSTWLHLIQQDDWDGSEQYK